MAVGEDRPVHGCPTGSCPVRAWVTGSAWHRAVPVHDVCCRVAKPWDAPRPWTAELHRAQSTGSPWAVVGAAPARSRSAQLQPAPARTAMGKTSRQIPCKCQVGTWPTESAAGPTGKAEKQDQQMPPRQHRRHQRPHYPARSRNSPDSSSVTALAAAPWCQRRLRGAGDPTQSTRVTPSPGEEVFSQPPAAAPTSTAWLATPRSPPPPLLIMHYAGATTPGRRVRYGCA